VYLSLIVGNHGESNFWWMQRDHVQKARNCKKRYQPQCLKVISTWYCVFALLNVYCIRWHGDSGSATTHMFAIRMDWWQCIAKHNGGLSAWKLRGMGPMHYSNRSLCFVLLRMERRLIAEIKAERLLHKLRVWSFSANFHIDLEHRVAMQFVQHVRWGNPVARKCFSSIWPFFWKKFASWWIGLFSASILPSLSISWKECYQEVMLNEVSSQVPHVLSNASTGPFFWKVTLCSSRPLFTK